MAPMRVLLGVSAGISAFKSVALASLLVRRGAEVRVLLTPAATRFVAPLSFAALTHGPVLHEELALAEDGVAAHISWARWAQVTLIAPATADLIGRMAAGLAGDLLSATLLAVRGRRILAPAMNPLMWENPLVQRNLETLRGLGWEQAGPAAGALADRESGPGRMLEPEALADLALGAPPAARS